MDTRDRERLPTATRRQRRMFVAYWAVVGAIGGVVGDPLVGYFTAGVWRIEPLMMAFRSIGMAITVGGAFWILTRPTAPQPEQRA